MPQLVEIQVNEDGETHRLSGIPDVAWERFTKAAEKHFPKAGKDAWAQFLSEVIVAGSGGADAVTYFMTDVPRANAEAMEKLLANVGWSWDKFHAYLLRAVAIDNSCRLIAFGETGQPDRYGTLIITGIKQEAWANLERVSGTSVERLMATFMLAATEGTLRFSPDADFAKPTKEDRPK
jgi:hypothetical protein